jgi:drug/metabolite transporter (DMT)-like permease
MPSLPLLLIGASAFMHAGWNLLAASRRTDDALFLRVTLITGLLGFVPALIAQIQGPGFPAAVWGPLLLTGACQATYYLGLSMGYRNGDFSVVYPLARALPVLLLAFIDLARGRAPLPLGWAGIGLVIIGCALVPLDSLRTLSLRRYRTPAMLWVLVTALGTAGYTAIDKMAAELLPPGPLTAARYAVLEAIATVPFVWLALRWAGRRAGSNHAVTKASWGWAAVAALFIFGAYWLVLWAYQLSPFASYIAALRQFSIVIGVAAAALIWREPARGMRLLAAFIITLGIICISIAQ